MNPFKVGILPWAFFISISEGLFIVNLTKTVPIRWEHQSLIKRRLKYRLKDQFDVDKYPIKRSYAAYEQIKQYPAAAEKYSLEKCKPSVFYHPGNTLYIFKSERICNFAVLTCSDFLSLRLRLKLQEKIKLLFVPAQNTDATSYDHIAESSMRDLHCYAVVCNNQSKGSSFIYGPTYEKNNRISMKIEGKIVPEFATVEIFPKALKASQEHDSQIPFRKDSSERNKEKKFGDWTLADLKQTPPDWGYPKKK